MTATIKRLRELLEKATEAPWCCCQHEHMACRDIADIGGVEIHSPSSPFVRADPEDDAALIVAAVNALPALLDALEKYRRVSESARDQWGDDYLWEKWGHDKDMAAAADAMAKLEAIQ